MAVSRRGFMATPWCGVRTISDRARRLQRHGLVTHRPGVHETATRSEGRRRIRSALAIRGLPELLVPNGFTCRRISVAGAASQADSGFVVPQAFDGMAAFPLGSNVRLIRASRVRT
jgi:hypothetical protein